MNYYAVVYYEPQFDITIYELACIVKIFFIGNTDYASDFIAKINFVDKETFELFTNKFQDVLRHFRIEIVDGDANSITTK